VQQRFEQPASVKVTARSSVVLAGDIVVEELDVDGALDVTVERGASLRIKRLVVRNAGWTQECTLLLCSLHSRACCLLVCRCRCLDAPSSLPGMHLVFTYTMARLEKGNLVLEPSCAGSGASSCAHTPTAHAATPPDLRDKFFTHAALCTRPAATCSHRQGL
jgi:hypothetical protein